MQGFSWAPRFCLAAYLLSGVGRAADVTLCTQGSDALPVIEFHWAKAEVAWMYSHIGIHVVWSNGKVSAGARIIRIHFVKSALDLSRPACQPDTLALATRITSDSPSITVLYDRIDSITTGRRGLLAPLLAHVLAHEIGHILKGNDIHEDCGVMKARWGPGDLEEMRRAPLSFTPADVEQMRSHIAWIHGAT